MWLMVVKRGKKTPLLSELLVENERWWHIYCTNTSKCQMVVYELILNHPLRAALRALSCLHGQTFSPMSLKSSVIRVKVTLNIKLVTKI